MKKGFVLKSLAVAVGIYALAGFVGVPYVLKHIAPEKIAEATGGGKFSVASAAFNPFTFHLKIKEIAFQTPEGENLLRMKRFSLNVDPTDFVWKGEWVIKEVVLVEPKVDVVRDKKGDFNFKFLSDLKKEPSTEESSKPLKLLIKRFSLHDGSLNYGDFSDDKAYTLGVGPIGFNLDNIDLRDLSTAQGKMRFYATINDGGFVELKGKIDALSPLKIGGSVAFDSGSLYTPWLYFKEKFPIEVADGKAAFGFDYRFDSSDLNATELSHASFGIDRLRIIPKGETRDLLTMNSLHLKEGTIFPMRKEFNADSFAINGLQVNARRGADGVIDWQRYVQEFQKAFPSDKNETKKEPWKYRIGSVSLEKVGAQWYDDAPKEPYHMSLLNAGVHTGVIESDERMPIELSAQTDAFEMIRNRDGKAVAGFGSFSADGVKIDREGNFASVENVSLLSPSFSFKRNKNGTLDLAGYAYGSKTSEKRAKGEGWGYRIDGIKVADAKVAFGDEVPVRPVDFLLDQLNLAVGNVQSDAKTKNTFSLDGRLNGRSALGLKGDFVRSSLSSSGEFTLKNLDLSTFDPYLSPSTYASLKRGDLSLNGTYRYASAKATVKGKVALSDWVVNDSRDDTVVLGWDRIGATPFTYAYPDNRLKINQLAIDGLYANAHVDEQKVFNFSTLSKKNAGDANVTKKPSANPFGLDIVKLLVRNSSATFSDASLPLPFKTYIHDLEGSILGISTTKDVQTFVTLRGGVDQYGLAKIDGSLNTKAPKSFTDLKVVFENLELPTYTPYSLQFLGYKIDEGKLFLDLGYKIDGGQMKGKNRVTIRQIGLGAEKEGGSPWPMRLVVALLEDSDGIIDIDLPVEGDVNKPDFKYGQVVWQVIKNLFNKAVTSPFRLLGSLLGIEDNSLASIDFERGSAILLPPQIEKLDKLVSVLQKRPKLTLEIYGSWNEAEDTYALKGQKLVQEALKRDKSQPIDSPNAVSIDLLEDIASDMLPRKERKAIRNSLEEQYPEEAAFVRHYSDALIQKLIPLQPLDPQELRSLADRRAAAVRARLAKTPGLENRLIVRESEKAEVNGEKDVPLRLNVIVP